MDPLTISAASGLRSRMESLDMLANNLANAGTAGFKKDVEVYNLYMSEAARALDAEEDPVTAHLPVIDRQWTDFSQGLLESTGNPLDLAIRGSGFLAVNTPQGTMYTRSGRMRVSAGGRLETLDGYTVRLRGGVQPKFDPGQPVEISNSGFVNQAGQVLGQLELVDFPDPSSMAKTSGPYFQTGQQATPALGAELLQGQIEGSNVNAAESAVRLVNVMRQFEMLTRSAHVGDDMNREAVEQVAKVGS
jgi:flagellar basal-body rod protein FlgG